MMEKAESKQIRFGNQIYSVTSLYQGKYKVTDRILDLRKKEGENQPLNNNQVKDF